ncbi:pentapeptide repeat-containing protein [Streptomyces sp. NPDC000594]|uniref:pentapeptide repeat-containing protein n=1 Tax=Streptomyces sp. NPDC000594 TaxID=3154261 RepID=UPI0033348B69
MPRDRADDDAIIRGVRFDGTPLLAVDAEAVEIDGCAFESSRLTGARFVRSQISDTSFSTCDFAEVRAQDVSLIRCEVSGSRFTGSSWAHGTYREVRFENCVFAPALLRSMRLFAVTFSQCRMVGVDLQNAELHNVLFENCDLTGAQFANIKIVKAGGVRFEDCTLVDVGGASSLAGAAVQGPGAMELTLSLAREAGIFIEP